MPASERRALLLLLGLAVAGQGVRHFATKPGEPPGQVQLLATFAPGSPVAQRDSAMRQGRPLDPGEQVDVDQAPVTELTRLPKVGPRLAKSIIADRVAHGPFGSLAGLDRVAGIGPGLLTAIGPHVVFSGVPRKSANPKLGPTATPLDLNTATVTELDALPGVGPSKAAAIVQYREQHGRFAAVDDLAQVRGFGPAVVSRLRGQLAVW